MRSAATHRICESIIGTVHCTLNLAPPYHTSVTVASFEHTRRPSLILLLQLPDLQRPHMSVSAKKKRFLCTLDRRYYVVSCQYRQLYQPCHRCLLLGSHCAHYQWQVFLPVDMCCVGGWHLNTVSSVCTRQYIFLFQRSFPKACILSPPCQKLAFVGRMHCEKNNAWRSEPRRAWIVTPAASLYMQWWHLMPVMKNMHESCCVFDTAGNCDDGC